MIVTKDFNFAGNTVHITVTVLRMLSVGQKYYFVRYLYEVFLGQMLSEKSEHFFTLKHRSYESILNIFFRTFSFFISM